MDPDELQVHRMNAAELRDVAGRVMAALAAGTITTAQANTITRAVAKRISTMEATMRAARAAGTIGRRAEPRKRQISGPE